MCKIFLLPWAGKVDLQTHHKSIDGTFVGMVSPTVTVMVALAGDETEDTLTNQFGLDYPIGWFTVHFTVNKYHGLNALRQ